MNQDGFIDISELEPYVANLDPLWEDTDEPKEIHISFTNDTSVMQVMWVTPVEYLENPIVYWGSDPENLTDSVIGLSYYLSESTLPTESLIKTKIPPPHKLFLTQP